MKHLNEELAIDFQSWWIPFVSWDSSWLSADDFIQLSNQFANKLLVPKYRQKVLFEFMRLIEEGLQENTGQLKLFGLL